MGEDFRRKQDKQFKCLMNRRFSEEYAPDLFSRLPPEQQDRITAIAVDDTVKEDSLLVVDYDERARVARLRHGASVAGEVHGGPAATLAQKVRRGGYVRVVSNEDGVMEGQVCARGAST